MGHGVHLTCRACCAMGGTVDEALPRIHRKRLGTVLEEARGCNLRQKPTRKQGAPSRCCQGVSASSLRPPPGGQCRPGHPCTAPGPAGTRRHHLGCAPGRANTSTLVASALAGGDFIDARCVLVGRSVPSAIHPGLPAASGGGMSRAELLARAWAAGAGATRP